ncbi:RNA polymerase sigma factor [Novipirellula artificiosorum]|uniref:RNA polymerase sigma factor n=1 Tax=Novipirellula artificiosorum TaxID=2528016 RepID=A0A5C6DQY1_9BACT|nr:RNA polymerase sigma factor [Novipirellula artificiosorum]
MRCDSNPSAVGGIRGAIDKRPQGFLDKKVGTTVRTQILLESDQLGGRGGFDRSAGPSLFWLDLHMNSGEIDIAKTLSQVADGDQIAAERLMPLVYERLRGLAYTMLNHESPGHTLQPTALVNETYLRMADQTRVDWRGKTHFFAIGAKMMRRILVDHARRHKRIKRGGGMDRIPLADDMQVTMRNDEDVLAVEAALEKLAALDPRQAQIVELRFFGGLTVEEVAEVIGVSKRTIEAEWTLLRAWLRRELSDERSS